MSSEENRTEEPTITADVCQEPEEPKAPDKICPTCIPNDSFVEPDWWDTPAPFLNERTCEYWANVSINAFGDTYTLSDLRGRGATEFKRIQKTYIRTGIKKMLRHFDKLEADEIICASPPQSLGGDCKDITHLSFEEWVDGRKEAVIAGAENAALVYRDPDGGPVDFTSQNEAQQYKNDFDNPYSDIITNTRALELYARAADYWVFSSSESVLHVLITIPAFVFDQVPAAPKKPQVQKNQEEVELNAFKLRSQLAMVKRAFSYFSKFQAFFYQYEGGNLRQEFKTEESLEYKTLYLKYLDDKLDLFEEHLETLISENGYNWATFTFSPKKVTHIKIAFNKDDENRPFDVDGVFVKAKGCDYVELTSGIDHFKSRDNVRNQTIMGYIANIRAMAKELEGRETPPWLDFVVKYTFPEISVDYGISNLTSDPIGSCALKQLDPYKLENYILDTVLSFQEAFAYQLNKQNCKMLAELNLADPMNPQSEKKNPDSFGVSKSWEKFTAKLEKDFKKNHGPLFRALRKIPNKLKKGIKRPSFGDILNMMSPCNWKSIVLDALKCIMAGMDIRTVYLIFIKKTLSRLAGEGLELVLDGLPRDKYEKVMEIVKKEFKDMPFPWETGYKPGEMPTKLADSKAIKAANEEYAARKNYNDSQTAFEAAKGRLRDLGINIDNYIQENVDLNMIEQYKLDKEANEAVEYAETLKAEASQSDDFDQDQLEEALQTIRDYSPDGEEYQESITAAQAEKALKINYTKAKYDDLFKIKQQPIKTEAIRILNNYMEKERLLSNERARLKQQEAVVEEAEKALEQAEKGKPPAKAQDYPPEYLKGQIVLEEKKGSYFSPYNIEDKDGKPQVTKATWGSKETKLNYTLIWSGKSKGKTKVNKTALKTVQTLLLTRLEQDKQSFVKRAQTALKTEKDKLETINNGIQIAEAALQKMTTHINTDKVKSTIKSSGSNSNISLPASVEINETTINLYVNLRSLESALKTEIAGLRVELTNNSRKMFKTDTSLAEDEDYIAWKSLSDEQKAIAIEQQKDLVARGIFTLEPGETVIPGTLGKALGSVQKAYVAALIDGILQSATVMEIMRSFDALPGSKLISAFLTTFKCPNTNFLWPPIDTFLNTLTYDPCGDGDTGIALPKIPEIGKFTGYNIWKVLRDAFVYALKLTVEEVLMSLLLKVAKFLDSALCKALGFLPAVMMNSLSPNPKSFGEVVDELICGKKNTNQKDKDSALQKVMKQAGAIPRNVPPAGTGPSSPDNVIRPAVEDSNITDELPAESPPANATQYSNTNPNAQNIGPKTNQEQQQLGKYKELSTLISTLATKDELINAMTSLPEEQDIAFMTNISNIVKLRMPEFAESFAGAEETIDFFTECGNLLTPDQRAALRNQANQPLSDYPIDSSVCMTNEDKALWDEQRKQAFQLAGMDPAIADEYVGKLNDRTNSDFAELVDALIDSPQDQFNKAIENSLVRPPDPDCKLPAMYDPYPGPTKETMKAIQEGLFKRVQMAFVEDLMAYNFFERFLGDPPGILNTILADKKGYTLSFHNFTASNKLIRFILTQEWTSDPIPTPETVCITLKNNMDKLSEDGGGYKYPFEENEIMISKEEHSLLMKYNNDLEDGAFKSKIMMYEILKEKDSSRIRQNFNYKLKIRSKFFNRTFIVEKQESLEEDELMSAIEPQDYFGTDYRVEVFRNFIKHKYRGLLQNVKIKREHAKVAFNAMNDLIFDDFSKKLMTGKNGDMPEGFYYGAEDVQLTVDDYEYVGPDGEEYDYDEEEMVLGKSKTDNPRVHFLDPAIYGGTYADPYKYIETVGECGGQRGWMKLARVFVPELQCGKGDTDFLYLKNLTNRIQKVTGQIEPNENLSFDPECVVEPAFDKIAAPATLAQLEGVVLATIRMHITDFIINAMPVLSNINLDFGRNYDEGISEYILFKIEQACKNEVSWWTRSKWEGENYYMLFLEQAVQTVMRMIDNEEMERNEELGKAYDAIEKSIKEYTVVNPEDISEGWQDGAVVAGGTTTGALLTMALIGASGPIGLLYVASAAAAGGFLFKIAKDAVKLSMARFAMKLYTIRQNISHCRTMLKYLIRNQLNFYRDELNLRLEPRPYIYDTAKYFIGASNVFSSEHCPNAGTSDIENPIGGGQIDNLTYGNIKNVVPSTDINPLSFESNNDQFTATASQKGAFYLEKYVRVLAPDHTSAVPRDKLKSELANMILNRDENLKGVVNISKFKEFLISIKEFITDTNNANISNALGPIVFKDIRQENEKPDAMPDEEFEMLESVSQTGVKFGVRLCYVPPDGFTMSDVQSTPFTRAEKSYHFETSHVYPATKHIFPICSYELDLPDGKIEDYINSDENMNQHIKCFVDNLTKEPEFKLVFDKIFDLKRSPSMLAIYSAINFLPSLGVSEDEREKEESIGDDGIGNTFNDTKYALRRLFIQCYKRKDFDPEDEEDEYDMLRDETRRLTSNMFRAITNEDKVRWWQKRRLIDKPFDCDGNSCGNAFSSLYEVKEKDSEKKKAEDRKEREREEREFRE